MVWKVVWIFGPDFLSGEVVVELSRNLVLLGSAGGAETRLKLRLAAGASTEGSPEGCSRIAVL